MSLDSHLQPQQVSADELKNNGESHTASEQELNKAGYSVPMTHAERQTFLKTSELGQKLGITNLLADANEES